MTPVLYRVRIMLRRRWKSTLLVVFVVAATCGLTLTLVAGAVRTLTAPNRYVEAAGLTVDAGIEQFEGPPRTDEVRELPSVSGAESVTFMFGGLVPSAGYTDHDEIDMFGLLDGLVFAGSPEAFGARIIEGRAADPDRLGEFVASRSFARSAAAAVGDTFVLVTISREQAAASGFDVAEPGGPVVEANLVGLFDGSATLQDDYPISVFPAPILDGRDIGISSTQIAVDLAPDATVDDLRAQLDSLQRGDTFAIKALEVVPAPVRAAVRTQGIGLAILALVVLAATIVVTGQLLGRELHLPETQRSALRTLGMTQDQLQAETLARAAVPAVVGAAVAAALSVAFSGLFPVGFAREVEPLPGVRFDPFVHLIGPTVLTAAFMAWLGTGLVSRRRARRPRATGRSDLAARVNPPQAATALRFTFGREQHDASSPRAQTAGLVIVLVLAVGSITFGANVARLLDEPDRQGRGDLGIGAGGGEIPQGIRDLLAADPEVEALTMFGAGIVSAGSQSLDIAGALPVVGDLNTTVLDGRLPVADDEIVLGRVAARRLGAGVGDEIELAGAAGPVTVRVTGLAVIPGIEGGDGLGEGGLMSLDGLRALDPDLPVSAGMLRLRPGAPDGTAERLSGLVGMSIGQFDPPGEIINLERIRSIPFVLVAVLGLLALLSLAHQLLQSFRQRRRDVAILRALGATRGWVTAVVHWQASLLTVLVFALAVPLGFIVGRSTYRVVANRIGAETDVFLPLAYLGVLVATLMVSANFAAAVSSLRVRRLPPAGYLNQE